MDYTSILKSIVDHGVTGQPAIDLATEINNQNRHERQANKEYDKMLAKAAKEQVQPQKKQKN